MINFIDLACYFITILNCSFVSIILENNKLSFFLIDFQGVLIKTIQQASDIFQTLFPLAFFLTITQQLYISSMFLDITVYRFEHIIYI